MEDVLTKKLTAVMPTNWKQQVPDMDTEGRWILGMRMNYWIQYDTTMPILTIQVSQVKGKI